MLHEIAIMSLEDRRPLRHVSLSEGEGGDEEESREVESLERPVCSAFAGGR
jgi:hypothetical protein